MNAGTLARLLCRHALTNGRADSSGYREVACACGWVQDGYGHRAHLATAILASPEWAEHERALKAEGWDNGWCDGHDDAALKRSMADTTRNPYRAAP